MEAGRLRHRVTIQNATLAQDAYGEPIKTWGTYATVWASVEQLDGREYWTAQQAQSDVNTRIRIRLRDGVTPLMRVSWDSRIFEIQTVIRDATNKRQMDLMCREVLDA